MFSQIETNGDLKKKYSEFIEKHCKEAENIFCDKLIEFGRASGFTFSKEDILAARSESRELSDDELSLVAGGANLPGTFLK